MTGTKVVILMSVLAAGDLISEVSPGAGAITNLGALGVLAWVAWSQRSEIRELRQSHASVVGSLCDRWDRWEQVRHDDSERLDSTLRTLVANCAAVQHYRDKN